MGRRGEGEAGGGRGGVQQDEERDGLCQGEGEGKQREG